MTTSNDSERVSLPNTPPTEARCEICGDTEPFHVHHGDRRIEDHFLVGRGMDTLAAARVWNRRALNAEARVASLEAALREVRDSLPDYAHGIARRVLEDECAAGVAS